MYNENGSETRGNNIVVYKRLVRNSSTILVARTSTSVGIRVFENLIVRTVRVHF